MPADHLAAIDALFDHAALIASAQAVPMQPVPRPPKPPATRKRGRYLMSAGQWNEHDNDDHMPTPVESIGLCDVFAAIEAEHGREWAERIACEVDQPFGPILDETAPRWTGGARFNYALNRRTRALRRAADQR